MSAHMNNCEAPYSKGYCQRTAPCELGKCQYGLLQKEIWDIGTCPFLQWAAQQFPKSSVHLIDGITMQAKAGYLPEDWDGSRVSVLNMHEAHLMRTHHPIEFQQYTAMGKSGG